MTLVLASGSAIRFQILKNAGLEIEIDPADIDERAIEAPLLRSGFPTEDLATILAESKAMNVSERRLNDTVIGADQMLVFENQRYTKPENIEDARRQLLRLSGKTHSLISAVVLVKNGETLWRHVSVAHLKMRNLTPEFIGRYLAMVDQETVLSSVGCYQLEKQGVQLFEKIEGDYFTILGLPLLPLLDQLRSRGFLET